MSVGACVVWCGANGLWMAHGGRRFFCETPALERDVVCGFRTVGVGSVVVASVSEGLITARRALEVTFAAIGLAQPLEVVWIESGAVQTFEDLLKTAQNG